MDKEPLLKLTWHGHETAEAIPSLLDRAEQLEINLPADYNHSLFACCTHMRPRPSWRTSKSQEVRGSWWTLPPSKGWKSLPASSSTLPPCKQPCGFPAPQR